MIIIENISIQKTEDTKSKKIKYIFEGKEVFAEEAAMHFYKNKGFNSKWTENQFWWTVLCLLFWDIIFFRTKGAVSYIIEGELIEPEPSDSNFDELFEQFISSNGMPSDFFTPDFYVKRKIIIDEHIQSLLKTDIKQFITNSYNTNYGKKCRLIENWDKYDLRDSSY